MVLEQYSHLGILLLFAVLFPSLPLIISYVVFKVGLRPKLPNAVKGDTYECGVETEGPTWVQFNFRYYLVALIFVLFDVEVIFLFPLAVALDSLAVFGHGRWTDLHRDPRPRTGLRMAPAGAGVALR